MRKKKENLENEEIKRKRERQIYAKKGKRKHNHRGGINPLYSRCNPRESKRRSTSEMGCLKEGCASHHKRRGKERKSRKVKCRKQEKEEPPGNAAGSLATFIPGLMPVNK